MGNEQQVVKMLPSSHDTVHTQGKSYFPIMGTPNAVNVDDVDELLAAGWSVVNGDCNRAIPLPPQSPITPEDIQRWAPKAQPGEKVLRLLAPARSKHTSVKLFSGRVFMPSSVGIVDAPESEAWALVGNSDWMILGQVDTSEERPATPRRGDRFNDTWLDAEVVFDGSAWRHTATGEEV